MAMDQMVGIVGAVLKKEQKEASRCFAPHIKTHLSPGYQVRDRQLSRPRLFLNNSGTSTGRCKNDWSRFSQPSERVFSPVH